MSMYGNWQCVIIDINMAMHDVKISQMKDYYDRRIRESKSNNQCKMCYDYGSDD